MTLPGAERAFVDPAKVRDYLLNPHHPVGYAKARGFSAQGFTRRRWPLLYRALVELAMDGEAETGEPATDVRKYTVRGAVTGLTGREEQIVSAWIVLKGEDFPRLVTAFPGDAR